MNTDAQVDFQLNIDYHACVSPLLPKTQIKMVAKELFKRHEPTG